MAILREDGEIIVAFQRIDCGCFMLCKGRRLRLRRSLLFSCQIARFSTILCRCVVCVVMGTESVVLVFCKVLVGVERVELNDQPGLNVGRNGRCPLSWSRRVGCDRVWEGIVLTRCGLFLRYALKVCVLRLLFDFAVLFWLRCVSLCSCSCCCCRRRRSKVFRRLVGGRSFGTISVVGVSLPCLSSVCGSESVSWKDPFSDIFVIHIAG